MIFVFLFNSIINAFAAGAFFVLDRPGAAALNLIFAVVCGYFAWRVS